MSKNRLLLRAISTLAVIFKTIYVPITIIHSFVHSWHKEGEAKKSYYDSLAALECDVLVVFGKDDPWCKPAFAKKMLETLDTRHPDKVHRYVELSNVGHCPNHEAPQAVARLLRAWADASGRTIAERSESNRRTVELVPGGRQVFPEPWGDISVQERHANDIPVSFMDRLSTSFVA